MLTCRNRGDMGTNMKKKQKWVRVVHYFQTAQILHIVHLTIGQSPAKSVISVIKNAAIAKPARVASL